MGEMDLSNDRIDVRFKDKKFLQILMKWKELCKQYGGQTERLKYLISIDINKIKEDIIKKVNNL
jgi:hypothetical protein